MQQRQLDITCSVIHGRFTTLGMTTREYDETLEKSRLLMEDSLPIVTQNALAAWAAIATCREVLRCGVSITIMPDAEGTETYTVDRIP